MTLLVRIKQIISSRYFHHLLFWSVVYSGMAILNQSGTFHVISDLNLVVLSGLLPFPVYLHFFLLEKFFNKKKYPFYFILALLLILISASIFRSLFSQKMQASNGLFSFTMTVSIFIMLTTGLKFLKSNFNQRISKQLNQANQLQAELEMVKSGINTGFMLRVLDQLYRLSLVKSSRIPELILQFSDMLRHTMEVSKKERIELAEEIGHIREYLNLEHQLSGYRLAIEVNGNLQIEIIPLVLVFLTEKILTGISHGAGKPVSGKIKCISDEKGILFLLEIIRTDKSQHLSFDSGEIEKKMQTFFRDRFSLAQREDEHFLSTTIQIYQDSLL
jgi:two-component system sensor histidine kinase LytS